jgi:hypothetical protein
MNLRALLAAAAAALIAGASPVAAGPTRSILFWAPFEAGSTEQAAGTMEAFARTVEAAAGWPAGSASAGYDNTVDGGLRAVEAGTPAFLIVPAPIYLRHARELRWKPLRVLVTDDGDAERYSVFGPAGASLADLAGAPVEGEVAYDAAFVAGVVLGKTPAQVKLDPRPTARVLSAVRRAVKGERLAVVLDEAQRRALGDVPDAAALTLLGQSPWMPAGILVASPSTPAGDANALVRALDRISKEPAAAELLGTMKIRRFEAVAARTLEDLGQRYARASTPASQARRSTD